MGRVRERIRVEGIVQGVGFRPFVHSLATESGLAGLVGNDTYGVFIEVEGDRDAVASFRDALRSDAPPLAVVERVSATSVPPTGEREFAIAQSQDGGARQTLISPDTATCAACLEELFDPADRRYRYPFLNCTHCGPRFTIVRGIPYDRPNTTMAGFGMCADCAAEYADPYDRRFHAQPVCCPACGPSLRLCDPSGTPRGGDPIRGAVTALAAGEVVAVKGLGGYHLAADAYAPAAVEALRSRKHREDKAFAVMVADVATARELCHVSEAEQECLTSPGRPVVLLERRDDTAAAARIADAVAPGNRFLGLMLPYTPLHHLLAAEFAAPFVLTSGNVSDEPIAYDDGAAFARLSRIADVFVTHDRPIHTRTDDSVVRVFRGARLPVRRSRGYVPQPLRLESPVPRPVLACGAELKNTFCLARDNRAFVSHHIGDLENYETLRSYTEGIAHFQRLFRIAPEVVAHDLHPDYLSTKYAQDLDDVELCGVQHHHAHIASCLADNEHAGPVIGVAFDGLGYGADGTIWGGEFLAADCADYQRAGHLAYIPMPGGTAAIREPWRMAAAYLDAAYGDDALVDAAGDLGVAGRNRERWEQVRSLARTGVSAPRTSSAGRLFDAVAALLGVRDRINYEGQAAVELEQLAEPDAGGAYPVTLAGERPFVAEGAELVRAVASELRAGVDGTVIAARFHTSVAELIAAGCVRIRETTGLDAVALSGGVFQNQLLLGRTADLLAEHGFRVLVHRRVPPNDGGISLGQAAVAAARDQTGGTRTSGS